MIKQNFLKGILGENGFNAFENAIGLSKNLEDVVFVRSLLSWVNLISKYGFTGNIPGQSNTLKLSKSESGLTGIIELNDHFWSFSNKSEEYIAAILALSLGSKCPKFDMNGSSIVKLGKSIDCLVKTEFVNKEVKKSWPKYIPSVKPSKTASPHEPVPLEQPQDIQPKQVRPPSDRVGTSLGKNEVKKKKSFIFKLKKHELNSKCETCRSSLFNKEDFIGCLCFNKEGVKLLKHNEDYIIKFDPDCDGDFILSLIGNIKDVEQ